MLFFQFGIIVFSILSFFQEMLFSIWIIVFSNLSCFQEMLFFIWNYCLFYSFIVSKNAILNLEWLSFIFFHFIKKFHFEFVNLKFATKKRRKSFRCFLATLHTYNPVPLLFSRQSLIKPNMLFQYFAWSLFTFITSWINQ